MQTEYTSMLELVPDMFDVLRRRYRILQSIEIHAPVGRRSLSLILDISERTLRTECDFLKSQNLLLSDRGGMTLTEKGQQLLKELESFMLQVTGVSPRERQLAKALGIEKAIIVSGDATEDENVLVACGRYLNELLQTELSEGENTITVLGGVTLKIAAQQFQPFDKQIQATFVSGRGGIGEKVDDQANTISAKMAEQTGGKHVSLYAPESVSEETYHNLLEEPSIKHVLDLISKSGYVIHGIGDAMQMAKNRGMTSVEIKQLQDKGAVVEAFGYFYDASGKEVYRIPRIGLQLKNLATIPHVFAIAAGSDKAIAIQSYLKNAPFQTWLITDEGVANQILKG